MPTNLPVHYEALVATFNQEKVLGDYEPLCGPSFEALMTGEVTSQQSPRYTGTSDEVLSAEFPHLDIDTVMNRYIIFGEGTYYSTLIN